jgi:hypothetical protein
MTKTKSTKTQSEVATKKSPSMDIEEGVLKDVLDQLEKERIKRAEVEAELFNLRKKVDDEAAAAAQLSLSSSSSSGCNALDEADRIHKTQIFLSELDENKKRSKKNMSSELIKFYTDIQDSMIDGASSKGSEDEKKARELHIKDEVSKILSIYAKYSPSLVWKYDEEIMKKILDKKTSDFILSLEKLNSVDKTKEEEDQKDKMRTELITLRTEKEGYLEIINALTPDNNAISLSAKDELNRKTLPLDKVQLMEYMPWDERVKSYVNDCDIVHQWQVYDKKTKKWADKIDLFPNEFSSNKMYKPDLSSPSRNRSGSAGRILDLSEGYPLPSKGTWGWIGGWKIEGVLHSNDKEEGWLYAAKPEHLKNNLKDKCFTEPNEASDKISPKSALNIFGIKDKGIPLRRYRRRIWKRQRILKAYPGISRATRHTLSLLEENAKLEFTVSKLHDQVYNLQTQLTDNEEYMNKKTAELRSKLSILTTENKQNSIELSSKSKENEALKKQVEKPPSQAGVKTIASTLIDSPIKSWGSNDSYYFETEKDTNSLLKSSEDVFGVGLESKDKEVKEQEKNVADKKTGDGELGSKDDGSSIKPKSNLPEPNSPLKTPKVRSLMPKSPLLKPTISPLLKPRNPLIALREIAVGPSNEANIGVEGDKNSKSNEIKSENKDTDEDTVTLTIFEDNDSIESESQQQQQQDKNKKEGRDRKGSYEFKARNIMDPFSWKKIDGEALINKMKNKVKDVENNVHNVKTNVQAIAGKAHSFQKIANQAK